MTRSPRRLARRPLRFDALEGRQLLAGSVSAGLMYGNGLMHLTIMGDNQANQVSVTDSPTHFVITPLDGESINGQPAGQSASVSKASFNGDVRVFLGAGNDKLVVNGIDWNRGLLVNNSFGNNQTFVEQSKIGHDLSISSGDGADFVKISHTEVVGLNTGVGISTGGGYDSVHVNDLVSKKDLRINVGHSVSQNGPVDIKGVYVSDSTIDKNLEVSSNTNPGWGAHTDVNLVRSTVGVSTQVTTGEGMDQVSLYAMIVRKDVTINTGAGDDTINLRHSYFGPRTYSGKHTPKVTVNAGDGNDTVFVRDTRAAHMVLDGGRGRNSLTVQDASLIQMLQYDNFASASISN